MNKRSLSAEARRKMILSIVLGVICVIYVLPVLTVVINSFKLNTYVKTDTFALPNAESFAGWANFIKGLTFGNYPFLKSAGYSLFITIVSTALILLCTSMAAWYIARVDSKFCRMVYYLCIFSMVVPFQMVMFTLSKTADTLKLNTPWTIPIIYLGFGAGLAIFMFVGFVKSIPLEIEEAAAIDGCGPLRTYFSVVLPMLRPTMISVGILEIMWVWNDYLLPYRARPHEVHDNPHPHPVPQGQLRHRRPRRDDGADPAEHHPCHRVLPAVPEVHHQGRGRRRGKGLTPFILHFPERSGSIDRTFLRHSDADLVPSLASRHRHDGQGRL